MIKPILQVSFLDDSNAGSLPTLPVIGGETVHEVTTSLTGVSNRNLAIERMRERMGGADVYLHKVSDLIPLPFPDPRNFSGIVIGGSKHYVRERDEFSWMPQLFDFIRMAVHAGVPMLGICFGHQSIAHALGGEVDSFEHGMYYLGPRRLHRQLDDPIFRDVPTEFHGYFAHSDHVRVLPEGARYLASSEVSSADMVQFAPQVYGVQFHPEFTPEIMAKITLGKEATEDQLAAHAEKYSSIAGAGLILENFIEMTKVSLSSRA